MADASQRYEVLAKLFYREELVMAPGKDYPGAMSPPSDEERREKWERWMRTRAVDALADRVVALESCIESIEGEIENV